MKATVTSVVAYHERRVQELDQQISGLRSRTLSPVRKSLRAKKAGHLRTIKLIKALYAKVKT